MWHCSLSGSFVSYSPFFPLNCSRTINRLEKILNFRSVLEYPTLDSLQNVGGSDRNPLTPPPPQLSAASLVSVELK